MKRLVLIILLILGMALTAMAFIGIEPVLISETDKIINAMKVEDVVKVTQKTWTINGKVVGIYQRVTLPDGSTQELKSDKLLPKEQWLEKAKEIYKLKLEAEKTEHENRFITIKCPHCGKEFEIERPF